MADTKLSALAELAATPAVDDEVYIRDVSEEAVAESKRITVANLIDSRLGALGATCWVIASDAKAETKAYAQILQASGYPVWVCDGTDDDVEIQAAWDAMLDYGELLCLGETFNITTGLDLQPSTSGKPKHFKCQGKIVATGCHAITLGGAKSLNNASIYIAHLYGGGASYDGITSKAANTCQVTFGLIENSRYGLFINADTYNILRNHFKGVIYAITNGIRVYSDGTHNAEDSIFECPFVYASNGDAIHTEGTLASLNTFICGAEAVGGLDINDTGRHNVFIMNVLTTPATIVISGTSILLHRTRGILRQIDLPEQTLYSLIPNGGMEAWSAGTTSPPNGWTMVNPGGATITKETTIKVSGEASARLRNGASNYCELRYDCDLSAFTSLLAGKTVTVRMKLRADFADRLWFHIRENAGIAGDTIAWSAKHSGDSTFETLSVTRTLPADLTKFRITVQIANGVDVVSAYIDEIVLVIGWGTPAFSPAPISEDGRIKFLTAGIINHSDLFMDVLAEDNDLVVDAEDLNGKSATDTCTVDGQPDVPRNLTYLMTDAADADLTMTITVVGVDARGNIVSEEQVWTAGQTTKTGNVAFATITSVTIDAIANNGAGDLLDIGIGSKLGLSNAIDATGDIYKVKENNGDKGLTNVTISATYDTVDMSKTDAIVGGDDFTVYYKSNLNIVS